MRKYIPDNIRQSFVEWSSMVDIPETHKLSNVMERTVAELRRLKKTPDSNAYAAIAESKFNKEFPELTQSQRATIQTALCAKFALSLDERLMHENLPERVSKYYPGCFERIEKDLRENKESDSFFPLRKYAGFLTLHSVPCGAQIVDTKSCVPISSALVSIFRMYSVTPFIKYLAQGGNGVWFRPHTDTDYLDEFNEKGFENYYLTVTDLLRKHQHIQGVVATSWFNDPMLRKVSPRLAYLFSAPMERGAFYIKHSSSEFDIQQATKTSPTRKRMYEEGSYIPTAYSIIWPRKAMLDWSESVSNTMKEELAR